MTFLIAEAGVNHNGKYDLAIQLIHTAKEAGANAVKFQIFDHKKLSSKNTPLTDYQKKQVGFASQQEMLQSLELTQKEFKELARYAESINIEFMATAFDTDNLSFLVNEIGVKRLKVASGELTNDIGLLHHAKYKIPIIISTGMATEEEILHALRILRIGSLYPESYWAKYCKQSQLNTEEYLPPENVTVLHCVSSYPAVLDQLNLNNILTFKDKFQLPVGFSDHSLGIRAPLIAATIGATVIEKHFTLDRKLPGPDHQASLEPNELKQLVHELRELPRILGNHSRIISADEFQNKKLVKRSLVAAAKVSQGEYFKLDHFETQRIEGGLEVKYAFDLIHTQAKKSYQAGDAIDIREFQESTIEPVI